MPTDAFQLVDLLSFHCSCTSALLSFVPSLAECDAANRKLYFLWVLGLALSRPSCFHDVDRFCCRPEAQRGGKFKQTKVLARVKPCGELGDSRILQVFQFLHQQCRRL